MARLTGVRAEAGSGAPNALSQARGMDTKPSLWVLRAGLAFVFLYAAVATVLHPEALAPYLPEWGHPWATARVLLPCFGAYELALAVGLMSRRHVYAAALLSAVTVTAITLLNLDAFDVLFRNVAIACAAAALSLEARRQR